VAIENAEGIFLCLILLGQRSDLPNYSGSWIAVYLCFLQWRDDVSDFERILVLLHQYFHQACSLAFVLDLDNVLDHDRGRLAAKTYLSWYR